ncbi:sigma factor, partial [Streptomyces hyaluromycini]|uniref:sigma factor n=1 Tax=Streptomyces hyaluromycini TaxID=1377993 RepID=UPI003D9DDA7C
MWRMPCSRACAPRCTSALAGHRVGSCPVPRMAGVPRFDGYALFVKPLGVAVEQPVSRASRALDSPGPLDGSIGRIARYASRASHLACRALQDKAVYVRDDRPMPWSSRKRGPRTDPNRSAHRVSGKGTLSTADEELLRTLYAEHAGALFHYVLRLTSGDWQWAEDVVQETLLRAWQHPAAFDPARGPARAWLCTVARRL